MRRAQTVFQEALEGTREDFDDSRDRHRRLRQRRCIDAVAACDNVDASTLAELAGIRSLRHVRIQGRKLADSFVSALSPLPLEELSIVGVALGEGKLSTIGSCRSLRRLHLEHTEPHRSPSARSRD